MEISVAIQTHPKRSHLVPRLAGALRPLSTQVVVDPEPDGPPNPWGTYRRVLEETPASATHRVILQDDVELCRNFAPALELAIAARPDRMLALCVCGLPRTSARAIFRAAERGEAWAIIDTARWVPVMALVWPVRMIRPGLAFVDEQNWPRMFRADDEIVGRIVRSLRERVLATVPSLVAHHDNQPSLIGRRAAYGRDAGRVTACWIDDCDPLTIEWDRGPVG